MTEPVEFQERSRLGAAPAQAGSVQKTFLTRNSTPASLPTYATSLAKSMKGEDNVSPVVPRERSDAVPLPATGAKGPVNVLMITGFKTFCKLGVIKSTPSPLL